MTPRAAKQKTIGVEGKKFSQLDSVPHSQSNESDLIFEPHPADAKDSRTESFTFFNPVPAHSHNQRTHNVKGLRMKKSHTNS